MKRLLILFALFISMSAFSQKTDTVFLKNLLLAHSEMFEGILKHPTQNEVQILYTRIDRDEHNIPHFTSYSYRLNPHHYFYPASTIKLPTAIFALEKLNELHVKRLTKKSTMLTDSGFTKQTKVTADSTARNGKPSIEQYIKKILLVSDNDAYNRLYEFVGRAEINTKLKKYQLTNTRIVGRLAVGDGGDNARTTNPIRFYKGKKLVYTASAQYDKADYPMDLENTMQGKGYIDNNGQLVMQPFNFNDKNAYPLADQQMVLKRLLFPEAFPKDQQYNLTPADYQLIYHYMSMYPTESKWPAYKQPGYYPAYCKFLYYGAEKDATINPNIRIFNKVGDSYGYDIDNAYIVDFDNKVEFMLSAVIQSNEDGIYNDDKYEYETICLPFLKNLGHVIYLDELNRPKKFQPNLSKFKFNY
ncbi:serine hydrolase [Mucilaginibacter polytrichastri]|uniref:beta-lactamase n=1 Tax=Mucilaginibacter polytrichastri TaxID=1302689 RepID=A0A1Q5ZWT4_9SPHI|nr:serine hydrolase [Mucilaginibacter polytrichastri]OKS86178.1 hypothetical protein RG47T_1629 [Mucilaginibacter polytrichastri]